MIDDGEIDFLISEGNETAFKKKLYLLMQDQQPRVSFGQVARVKMQQFEAAEIAKRFHTFIRPLGK
ncbi:hypothetical protein A3SI_06724 [Nitritalea halalkaliphila LW7]|uniref:Uncharacterized protein n=1 Tax=Nitritalea halalkaliphila LW7 TaxID=1189621 RepID=I5C608_9BACT|nr:hypothetical protein A3SI_06724 [Nitritalea halalkaliphila LW7]